MKAFNDLKRNFLKAGGNKIHWGKTLRSIIVIVALILFIIYNNHRLDRRNRERLESIKYTIGITGKEYHNIKGSKPTVKYYYSVLGKKYKGNQDIDVEY